jgi:hypothetical protein
VLQITTSGSFDNTDRFLSHMSKGDIYKALDSYAQRGVEALSSATPERTGATAASWSYEVTNDGKTFTIAWVNTHLAGGVPVAILLQYGHGTGTGGYVQGRDYINPAIRPIFDEIADQVWREVTSA